MKKSKQEIKNRILLLTRNRGSEKSVSPSEVARDLFSNVWKEHLDEVRTMAGELESERLIKISHKGKNIRIDEAKGPIRMSILRDSD